MYIVVLLIILPSFEEKPKKLEARCNAEQSIVRVRFLALVGHPLFQPLTVHALVCGTKARCVEF